MEEPSKKSHLLPVNNFAKRKEFILIIIFSTAKFNLRVLFYNST